MGNPMRKPKKKLQNKLKKTKNAYKMGTSKQKLTLKALSKTGKSQLKKGY
tara:strand:- start:346 stop:495 length:150 start_codon:yes stop_codon:yes gene_type:complete